MTVRIATVLSAREWEPDLVAHVREAATARLVLRAYLPTEIHDRADDLDVVVAGSDVAWVTPARIEGWRRLGLGVVGIHPPGDLPAAEMFERAEVDEVLPDDVPPEAIVAAARFAATLHTGIGVAPREGPSGRLTVVVGPRGAPGCTEVAIATAWNLGRRSRTLLVDLDLEGPALAVRLGLPPRPDLTDAIDRVRADGVLPDDAVHRLGPLDVLVGSHRPGLPELRRSAIDDVVEAALHRYDHVVCDRGHVRPDDLVLKRADDALLVVDAAAVGIVRAAVVAGEWAGPAPRVVLNRVAAGRRGEASAAVRRWLGLDPVVVVPDHPKIRAAALSAHPPDRRLRRLLAPIGATS